MILDPSTEPPIDTSLTHHMEARALEVALGKAVDDGQRAGVERLLALRGELMQQRDAFLDDAKAKRHARGEVYSAARVAAINAMGPSRASMEELVRSLYLRAPDAVSVLKNHARSHFAYGLISQRLLVASNTPDVIGAARVMQAREEAFASAWVTTIDDAGFAAELRKAQREALLVLRTSTRPMFLVTQPAVDTLDDSDAQILGKAWRKLDELAGTLGIEPLSAFIAVPGEADAGMPAAQILPTVIALIDAINAPGSKFPAKRASLSALGRVRDALVALDARSGRAHFEVDI